MSRRVFLDPDGTHDVGDYVLVQAPTGIVYESQTAGLATEVRSAEGFLVSVGPSAAVRAIDAWFVRTAAGRGHDPSTRWPRALVEALSALIADVRCWRRDDDGEDRPHALALDEARLDDCVEAWIPVVTPLGPGVLLRPNSD